MSLGIFSDPSQQQEEDGQYGEAQASNARHNPTSSQADRRALNPAREEEKAKVKQQLVSLDGRSCVFRQNKLKSRILTGSSQRPASADRSRL